MSTAFERAKRRDGAKCANETRKRNSEKRGAKAERRRIQKVVEKWRDEADKGYQSDREYYPEAASICLHSRDAYQRVLDLLDGEEADNANPGT